jgi:hypothetical protein
MAARTKKIRHPEDTRLKIQTSQLINRLNSHAVGKVDLSPTQVKAIEILLRKALPDLSAVDATMNGEMVNYVVSAEPMTEDDWETTYGVEPTGGPAKSTH